MIMNLLFAEKMLNAAHMKLATALIINFFTQLW